MTDNLSIDGVNIYYKGNMKQGAVVFIHGCSLNGSIFKGQFKHIGFFLMPAIDLPGHEDARSVAGEMLQHIEELMELLADCMMQADHTTRLAFSASLGLDKFKDEFKLLHHFKKPLAIIQGKTTALSTTAI
jgi:hypothetical protein